MSSFAQKDLFGTPQPDLFADAPKPAAYVPKAEHVRNRFIDFMAQMTAAETWPWDETRVDFFRETVWPYLYAKMPDQAEAAEWRHKMEAEATRLDAAR